MQVELLPFRKINDEAKAIELCNKNGHKAGPGKSPPLDLECLDFEEFPFYWMGVKFGGHTGFINKFSNLVYYQCVECRRVIATRARSAFP